MSFPANPARGEQAGDWEWDGERWRSTASGGSFNPNPCPPPNDGTVGPPFIDVTVDAVTLPIDVFASVCTLMLTPGDWDAWGAFNVETLNQGGGAFASLNYQALIWNAPGPIESPIVPLVTTNRGGRIGFVPNAETGAVGAFIMTLGPMRWLVSAPTQIWLLAFCEPDPNVTTQTTFLANGYLAARRHGPWSSRSAPPAFEVFRGPARVSGFGE